MKISLAVFKIKYKSQLYANLLITKSSFLLNGIFMADASKLAAFIALLKKGLPISDDPFHPNYIDLSKGCIALEEEEQDLAAVCIANTYFPTITKNTWRNCE